MKSTRILINMLVVLAIIAGTVGCTRQGGVLSMYPVKATFAVQPSIVNAASLEKVILGVNDFAFRLTDAMLIVNGEDNLLLSPFSVWLPLAALINATDAGYREDFSAALGVKGVSEEELNQTVALILNELTSPRDTVESSYYPLSTLRTSLTNKKHEFPSP